MSKIVSVVDNHEFMFGEFGCFHVLTTCFMAVTPSILKRYTSDNFIFSNILMPKILICVKNILQPLSKTNPILDRKIMCVHCSLVFPHILSNGQSQLRSSIYHTYKVIKYLMLTFQANSLQYFDCDILKFPLGESFQSSVDMIIPNYFSHFLFSLFSITVRQQ